MDNPNNFIPNNVVDDNQNEQQLQISTNLRTNMLGALYQVGDDDYQDEILQAWGLKQNEFPAEFDAVNKRWLFKGTEINANYVSVEEQNQLQVQTCPPSIMKMCSNRKRMYFLLTNQLDIILPQKDYCTKKFMWSCLIGLKKFMAKDGQMNGLKWKKHKPGFKIKENSCKYWCQYIVEFPGWKHYVPDAYIERIIEEASIEDVEDRQYVSFDTNYLLSLFRSLDEGKYARILRSMFDLRQERLTKKAQLPPMMIQSVFIQRITEMYEGDSMTSIVPSNLKKCRQKSMVNQLPKFIKDRHDLKRTLKKASRIVRKNMTAKELGLNEEDEEHSEFGAIDINKTPTNKKKTFQLTNAIIEEEEKEPSSIALRTRSRHNRSGMDIEVKPTQKTYQDKLRAYESSGDDIM